MSWRYKPFAKQAPIDRISPSNTSHNLICAINAEGVEFSATSKESWFFADFSVLKECDSE
jgi:hypothetical protein